MDIFFLTQAAAQEYEKYDFSTGKLKPEFAGPIAPPPSMADMPPPAPGGGYGYGAPPPPGPPGGMRTQGRYVDVLASSGRTNVFR